MHQQVMVPAKPVAIARICIGLAAVAVTMEGHAFFLRIAEGKLAVPLLSWWPTPSDLPLTALLVVGLIAGVGLTLGCCTRTCVGLTLVVQGITLGTDQQLYSNHRVLLVLLCCHLLFAQSDAALSLRSRYRGGRELVPLWPQLLMIGTLSSLYLFAGLSKINDVFLAGGVLETHMVIQLGAPWTVLLSYATVVTEIFLGLGVWFRQTRHLAVLVGVALHLSIVALLGDPFVLQSFALLCVGLYPIVVSRPIGAADADALPAHLVRSA